MGALLSRLYLLLIPWKALNALYLTQSPYAPQTRRRARFCSQIFSLYCSLTLLLFLPIFAATPYGPPTPGRLIYRPYSLPSSHRFCNISPESILLQTESSMPLLKVRQRPCRRFAFCRSAAPPPNFLRCSRHSPPDRSLPVAAAAVLSALASSRQSCVRGIWLRVVAI